MPRKKRTTVQRVPPNFGTELGTAPRRAPVTAPLFQPRKTRIKESDVPAYTSHVFARGEAQRIERDRLSEGSRSALGKHLAASPRARLAKGSQSALGKRLTAVHNARPQPTKVHQTAAQKEEQRHIAAGSKGALIKTKRKNSATAQRHEAKARLTLLESNKSHAAAVLAKTGSDSAKSKFERAERLWVEEANDYRRKYGRGA